MSVDVFPYNPGRWRLMPWALKDVRLSFAIIVLPGLRDEDIQRATKIVESLRQRPDDFSGVAKASSTDSNTRDLGGTIGVADASKLPGGLLDAFGSLNEGEVSDIFKFRGALALIRRLPVPAERILGGRILTFHPHIDKSQRVSQPELVARMTHIYTVGQRTGDYSGAADSEGFSVDDTGVRAWSTYQPDARHIELAWMGTIPNGATSPIIVTDDGYSVVQREDAGASGYSAPKQSLMFDLPSPKQVDVLKWVNALAPAEAGIACERYMQSVIRDFRLNREKAVPFREHLQPICRSLRDSAPGARGPLLHAGVAEVVKVLAGGSRQEPTQQVALAHLSNWMEREVLHL